jgi:hypothetical protein
MKCRLSDSTLTYCSLMRDQRQLPIYPSVSNDDWRLTSVLRPNKHHLLLLTVLKRVVGLALLSCGIEANLGHTATVKIRSLTEETQIGSCNP